MFQIRKISLIGLGAMGSFFAPRLYQAFGTDFRLIASGSRKERLETNGVTINGTNYHFPVVEPAATGDPADLVIIATKGYDFDAAIQDIQNQVGPHTQILGIINGIEAEGKLIAAFGSEHVLYSLMRVSIAMKDGVTNFDPESGAVFFGEKNGNLPDQYTERVMAVKHTMEKAGIPYKIEEDMQKSIWYKYACNVSENLTCALLSIPFGWFRKNTYANALREKAFREVVNVAKAVDNIQFTQDDLDKQNHVLKKIPPENKPSTLQDLEARKNTEIDMFAKTMIDLGNKYNVETPCCEMFYYGIHVLERKNELLLTGGNDWD